jgi:hypothetical protein
MALKRLSITALLAGALVGLSLTAARADEPMTADQADAAAQAARKEADHYRQLGGVGYKAGLVQASEAEAARYDAMAQKLAPAPTAAEPQAQAPGAYSYETASAVQYEAMRPGSQIEAQNAAQLAAQGSGQTPNPTCENTKPVTDFLCQEHQKHQEQRQQQQQ